MSQTTGPVRDLDGTLIAAPSSERRFAAWLVRQRAIGARQGLAWPWFLASAWPRFGWHTPRKDKAYVAGLPRARVAALERHRARGDGTVLLSGTLQPLADALGARLGFGRAIGSCAPLRGERYRIGAPLRHPFGVEKLALVEASCAERGLPLGAVTAYADSIDERWLLERVGEPVAPALALARLARRRGWAILAHRGTLAKPVLPVHAP